MPEHVTAQPGAIGRRDPTVGVDEVVPASRPKQRIEDHRRRDEDFAKGCVPAPRALTECMSDRKTYTSCTSSDKSNFILQFKFV